jgi:bifunctional non-homologous end joining protein LigD
MLPMLATSADRAPTGPEWSHEVKWDGMRIVAEVRNQRLRLASRAGVDATDRFPELAGLADLYEDYVVDGEVIVLDGGSPSFGALAERIHIRDRATALRLSAARPVTFMAFDVMRLLGAEVIDLPWQERRDLLERLDLHGPCWQTPPTYDDGAALAQATLEQGLEGVVSKRRASRYTPGRRSPDWVKVPHRPLRSVVVGGWRPERGDESRLGALLIGEPTGTGLSLLGRVGSGLAGRAQSSVLVELRSLASLDCPFVGDLPREDAAGAHWVRPELVVDVRSLATAPGERLRHPVFHAVREDLTPDDVAAHRDLEL